MEKVYCLDTSSLIRAWHEAYPRDVFGSFWDRLEAAIDDGLFISPDEVLRETKKRSDGLHDWLKARDGLFVDIDDEIQDAVAGLMAEFPLLAKNRKGANAADPWVIALAQVRDAVVVTEESPIDAAKKPKIPGVCRHYEIECVNLLSLIREVGWSF